MTFELKLTDEKLELALEMNASGSNMDLVAEALGVSSSYLRDKMRYYRQRKNLPAVISKNDFRQRPLDRSQKDTRSFTQRFMGDPIPNTGRSALERLRAQQPERWQPMSVSAIPTSCINRSPSE